MARKTARAANLSGSSSSSLTSSTSGVPALALTPFQANMALLNTNTLVALSQVPGNLDYDAYVQYLTQHGHLRNPQLIQGLVIPAQPTNSSLLQLDRGDRTDGLTDYRPDQALWSQNNLPEIIYIFDKPNNWLGRAHLKEPPTKSYPIYGQLLRDIPILPDHISPDLEGWRYEAYCRFDPRIKKDDIVSRMLPQARGQHNSDLSMRTIRFRRDANVLGWVAKGGKFAEDKLRIQVLLQAAGIPLNSNTTRGVTWGSRPNGQPIPVPGKLRWDSCVEAVSVKAPVAPVVPAMINAVVPPALVAAVPGPVSSPVPAIPGPAWASPISFTATTNTIPSVQATNIPATQAASAHGTPIPALNIVLLSSSSSSTTSHSQLQHSKTSVGPQNISTNSVTSAPKSDLDPRLFQTCSLSQIPTTRVMNPPTLPPIRAGAMIKSRPSISMPTTTGALGQAFTGSLPDHQKISPRLPEPQRAPKSYQGSARPSLTNPIPVATLDLKRKRDNDDQERDPTYRGPNNERPIKKLCSAPQGRFRTRWPRTAFGGVIEDMPQSLNKRIQQANSSDFVNEDTLVKNEQIQPARPSLGYHEALLYVHNGHDDVGAPEDFLHPDGVDAGRLKRLGHHERKRNGVDTGGLMLVRAKGASVDYGQTDRAGHPEVVSVRTPVEYTPQVMGWYLVELPKGWSHILTQDLASSDYPPLE